MGILLLLFLILVRKVVFGVEVCVRVYMDMVTCERLLALVLGSKMLAVGMDCGFVSIRVIGMQPKGIVCVDQGKVR